MKHIYAWVMVLFFALPVVAGSVDGDDAVDLAGVELAVVAHPVKTALSSYQTEPETNQSVFLGATLAKRLNSEGRIEPVVVADVEEGAQSIVNRVTPPGRLFPLGTGVGNGLFAREAKAVFDFLAPLMAEDVSGDSFGARAYKWVQRYEAPSAMTTASTAFYHALGQAFLVDLDTILSPHLRSTHIVVVDDGEAEVKEGAAAAAAAVGADDDAAQKEGDDAAAETIHTVERAALVPGKSAIAMTGGKTFVLDSASDAMMAAAQALTREERAELLTRLPQELAVYAANAEETVAAVKADRAEVFENLRTSRKETKPTWRHPAESLDRHTKAARARQVETERQALMGKFDTEGHYLDLEDVMRNVALLRTAIESVRTAAEVADDADIKDINELLAAGKAAFEAFDDARTWGADIYKKLNAMRPYSEYVSNWMNPFARCCKW